ncbi:hypothetical protein D9M68_963940 [compost metagenome]
MRLEQHAAGKRASQILAHGDIAFIAEELPDEFDILGTHIVERRIDLAAAEHLDLEIGLLASALAQHLVDQLLHGKGAVARRGPVAILG